MAKKYYGSDIIVLSLIMLIGVAEIAHLFGVFFHRPFSDCTFIFCGLTVLAVIMLICFVFYQKKRRIASDTAPAPWTGGQKALAVIIMVLFLSQLLFIVIGKNVYLEGDMTVETVGSFLQTNGFYQVNPMTGTPYETGIPSRLKILCLPTMYAVFCELFHTDVRTMVWQIVPVLTLLCCYAAYLSLGRRLFPENRRKQLLFLLIVALLIWVGSYAYGMDGFGILCSGWRGVTLRNAVLIPFTFAMCLEKRYLPALLGIAAEACIVWTLYGMGACIFVIAGMALTQFLVDKRAGKETVR